MSMHRAVRWVARVGRRPRSEGHRDDIQGLRAVAVLLVVLAHAGVGFLAGGFVGVDVFFVLSGFLITGLLAAEARRRRFVSLTGFYLRRARRILPAATVTLVVSDLFAYHFLNIVRAQQYLRDSISGALFVANFHFAAEGTDYFAQGQPPSPFQHFWSLGVEEQFYVVWPALFILALGLSFRRYATRPKVLEQERQRRVLVAVLAVAAISLVWSIIATGRNQASAYFSTPARAWELALGAALALGAPRLEGLSHRSRLLLGWGGLAAIAGAALAYSAATPFPGYAALLPTLGAAAVIAAGTARTPARWSVARVVSIGPLRYIGDRSYSFYLWHWPVLVITEQAVGHSLALGTRLALMVGAFGLSVVTYRVVESPIRFARSTRSAFALPVLVAASVLSVLVVTTTDLASIRDYEDQQSFATTTAPAPGVITPPAVAVAAVSLPSRTTAAGSQALAPVDHEVSLDAHGRRLPSVLGPPVAQLLNDLPTGYPGKCVAGPGQDQSPVCRLGDTASQRTIAIIGDSHMQMWLPDLIAAARLHGWAVVPLIKEGCSPPDWLGHGGGAPACPPWFRWAMAQARQIRPTDVLIGGSYSTQGSTLNPETDPGFGAEIGDLRHVSQRIVLVGDVPARQRQPVDCLLASGALASCAQPLSGFAIGEIAQMKAYASVMHVGFIDPTGWFCAQQECPLVVGDVITYRDTGHISATYAHELQDVFGAAVAAAIR
jgi:peptidoglycan/LPS O-acetylase OafA/YrhL